MKKLILSILCLPIFGFAQCISGDCYNGQGTMILSNEDVYVGEYKYGKKYGQGTYIWASGTIYAGEWKDGEEHGQGTCIWSSGEKYVGEYKYGQIYGQGTYTWPSGNKYIGEWKDGLMNGQGTYTWSSGTIYTGEWKDGKKHGKGTKTDASGSVYKGLWDNNVLTQTEDLPHNEEKMIDYITYFEEEEVTDEVFVIVEDMPRFQGCADDQCTQIEIMKYIAKNTNYPPIAKENNITGRVFVSFVVDKTGKVTQVKVLRGVDKYIDAEAVRVVQSMPRFKPGKQKGKTVSVQYNVPINFKLGAPTEEK